jgi:predicted nucleic-acid-binding protein
VLIRHLTGDPPEAAERATRFLREAQDLLVADLIVAECVFVLESFYELERTRVAELIRAVVSFPSIRVVDTSLLFRALELYEIEGLHFAEAYLIANAETSPTPRIASFDRAIDRVSTVERIEP